MMCCRDRRQQTQYLPKWLKRKSNKRPMKMDQEVLAAEIAKASQMGVQAVKMELSTAADSAEEEASEIKAAK